MPGHSYNYHLQVFFKDPRTAAFVYQRIRHMILPAPDHDGITVQDTTLQDIFADCRQLAAGSARHGISLHFEKDNKTMPWREAQWLFEQDAHLVCCERLCARTGASQQGYFSAAPNIPEQPQDNRSQSCLQQWFQHFSLKISNLRCWHKGQPAQSGGLGYGD